MLLYILLATFLASIVSLLLVTGILLIKKLPKIVLLVLISLATGVLMATAFLDLLPEALKEAKNPEGVFIWPLSGMVVFFIFEQFFHWYHHHRAHGDSNPSVLLVTFGDGLHNFMDGIAIAAAFLTNFHLGVITSIAVFIHEIPHEIADVSVYIHNKLGKKKTLLFNLSSGLTAIFGAIITFYFGKQFQEYLPAVIGFTAGNFIYIAGSDLIPELHHATGKKANPWIMVSMFLTGILTVALLRSFLDT